MALVGIFPQSITESMELAQLYDVLEILLHAIPLQTIMGVENLELIIADTNLTWSRQDTSAYPIDDRH